VELLFVSRPAVETERVFPSIYLDAQPLGGSVRASFFLYDVCSVIIVFFSRRGPTIKKERLALIVANFPYITHTARCCCRRRPMLTL
jgi:hypothetical protein